MKGDFSMNFATFIICLVLTLIVTSIIVSLVNDKKKGKSSCGCNCPHCTMLSSCHKYTKRDEP